MNKSKTATSVTPVALVLVRYPCYLVKRPPVTVWTWTAFFLFCHAAEEAKTLQRPKSSGGK